MNDSRRGVLRAASMCVTVQNVMLQHGQMRILGSIYSEAVAEKQRDRMRRAMTVGQTRDYIVY